MKNSFLVKFAIKLAFGFLKKKVASWVASWILGGPMGWILTYFAEKFLGFMVDQGILLIDLGIIGAQVAMQKEEYEEFAKEAYARASRKVYNEREKQKIRKQYLDALSKFGTMDGHGMQHNGDPKH